VRLWDFDVVATAFADAALDPALWVKAMDTIAGQTGSAGATLFPIDGAIPNVPISDSLRRSVDIYFRDGWHLRDERFRATGAMIRDRVADDFSFTNPREMERHPYYQEFLRPVGLQYFAAVKMAAGDDLWAVSIQRSLEQRPFSAPEKRKLAALSERIGSAAALARALGFAAANAAVEAFEVSGSAVALLDRRGEVLRINRAAETLLCHELRIVEKRIASHDADATAALNRTLHALLWTGASSALMPPVRLPRPGRRPILAYPLKLSTVAASVFAQCQALVVLVDLERRARPPQEELHSSFGLTPAEARLAIQMASGLPLETIADELRVSKETARSQLKSVFQKTGVRRQAELVGLLASFLNARQ
jgi:DNA-binding CsgD family transcriptional regulator